MLLKTGRYTTHWYNCLPFLDLDELAYRPNTSYHPILVTGDFNIEPYTDIHRLITKGRALVIKLTVLFHKLEQKIIVLYLKTIPIVSFAEPALFWAAPASGGQGSGADSGSVSDLLGSAPAPRLTRRLQAAPTPQHCL